MRELVVFPTELAMRRYQQGQALEHGWVDASCHTTFSRLLKLCLPYANAKGERMDGVQQLLMRRHVIEVASGHFAGQGALGELSSNALGDVLDKLLVELASMPGETTRIIDWLLDHHRKHKLYQLGTLISVWRAFIKQEGMADQLDLNLAILKLLKGNRNKWPPLLRDCRQLTYRAVRWFNPFEESCVAALNQKLKVSIESALPPAHAEAAADRLGQQIRSEIMAEPWAVWAEDLGDALAVDSPDVLQLADSSRINFSRAAGAYGEIEDLARRICWNIQSRGVAPSRIALVVPNIGAVQDIVPHVFSRFGIPYFFRRGRPVLSSPVVKAFFAWLAFPLRPERDTLIDLVRNPALRFEDREGAVEVLLKQPPRLDPTEGSAETEGSVLLFNVFEEKHYFIGLTPVGCSGAGALEILKARVVEPEDHFNSEALKAVESALEGFGEQSLPLNELVDLLEEYLENTTVRPRDSHEQGVWILNPHDAVGLDFNVVLLAGLNEGEFPTVPQQDALLSDAERNSLRLHLEGQGRRLPKMALPKADVLFEQQSVMFLTALGMAQEQLVFSFQSVDQEGNEKGEGEYYRKLWNLAGWCAHDKIEPSPYDQWRMGQLGADSIFENHLKTQQATAPEDREPMPGESFLPIVPLPLCRATDEALQSAVNGGTSSTSSSVGADAVGVEPDPPTVLEHLVAMLKIEAEREAFLETEADERRPSKYCGHISALKEKVADWFVQKDELSPTALEALAHCRYAFLLEMVFGIRDPRMADDAPDPMDRGTLIHSILKDIYTAIANCETGIDAPRRWAVEASGGWRIRNEGGADAIPLATVAPEHIDFAREVAVRRMDKSTLGHPGVWAAEREKVLEMVLNFVRHDVETCAEENRFPALFELDFGGDTAVDLGEVRLKGRVDRVDLVFAATGELEKLRVLDYKGSSRSRNRREDYIEEIIRNLDCQLPVYAFAAQQRFFGKHNIDVVNAMTEAGYLFYERKIGDAVAKSKKSIIPMDEEGMADAFLATLLANLQRLKDGDFAVDPLIEAYTDYSSVCRTEAVARDELE